MDKDMDINGIWNQKSRMRTITEKKKQIWNSIIHAAAIINMNTYLESLKKKLHSQK